MSHGTGERAAAPALPGAAGGHSMPALLCPFSSLPVVVLSAGLAPAEPASDLLIRNGKIGDGTGNPWFHGDVAVQGGGIAALGRVPSGTARREIGARGVVVAPVFTDMHWPSDSVLCEDGDARS